MTKLSKYEKETIINWNEAENLARAVDPAHPAVQRGTKSRCQRLRQRAWLSGGDDRRKNSLKWGDYGENAGSAPGV